MKLKFIRISNFKAFGKEFQTIPIKPLTLVFGPNSAGKSSVIHALLWLNHAETRGETDVHRPALAENTVNLGGFDTCLNRQSGMHRLRMTLTLTAFDPEPNTPHWLGNGSEFTLGFACARSQRNREADIIKCKLVSSEGLLLDISKPTKDQSRAETELSGNFRVETPVWEPHLAAIEADAIVSLAMAEELCHLQISRSKFLPLSVTNHHRFGDKIARYRKELKDRGVTLLSTDEELIQARNYVSTQICRPLTQILQKFCGIVREMVYLPPLREIPDRSTDLQGCELPGWRLIADHQELLDPVNRTLETLKIAHRLSVRTLIPTSVAEDAIYRIVVQSDEDESCHGVLTSAINSGREHWSAMNSHDHQKWIEGLPDFFDKIVEWERNAIFDDRGYFNVVESDYRIEFPESPEGKIPAWWINEYAEKKAWDMVRNWATGGGFYEEDAREFFISTHPEVRQAIGRTLKSQGLKNYLLPGDGNLQLRLHDPKRNTWVSLQEVGVGTSQILPIILEAHGQKDKLLLIEQPELHLHPALQAELGDVFIESALGENKNTFLIETHSEHLILRILRRIRETTEGAMADWPEALRLACPKGIRPEDVAVLYVEPGDDGARVIELPVTPDGDFSKAWPDGFFSERSKELF